MLIGQDVSRGPHDAQVREHSPLRYPQATIPQGYFLHSVFPVKVRYQPHTRWVHEYCCPVTVRAPRASQSVVSHSRGRCTRVNKEIVSWDKKIKGVPKCFSTTLVALSYAC